MADILYNLVTNPLFLSICGMSGIAAYFVIKHYMNRGKKPVMYWISNKKFKIMWKNIKNDKIVIDKKVWPVIEAPDILYQVGHTDRQIYIVHNNHAPPMKFTKSGLEESISPENMKELLNFTFIDKLLHPDQGKDLIIGMIIGGVLGGIMGFAIKTMIK